MEYFGWRNRQDRSTNEDTSDQQSYANIPEWEEIFDGPIGHVQKEDQMLVNQMLSQLNLTVGQHQPRVQQQCLQNLPSCVFSRSSQLPPTMQVQNSCQSQLPVYAATNQLYAQHHQQQLYYNLHKMQPCASLPSSQGSSTIQDQLSVNPAPTQHQLSDQQLQHNSLETNAFSLPSQSTSTIQDQSNLQGNLTSQKPKDPQHPINQAPFSPPEGVVPFAYTVSASPATQQQYQERIQQHSCHQQLQTEAPSDPVPFSLPDVTNAQRPSMKKRLNVGTSRENFLRRLAKSCPRRKKKLKEMQHLIKLTKKRRLELRLSRKDYIKELNNLSTTRITKWHVIYLDSFTLKFESMYSLKPLLVSWLFEKQIEQEPPETTAHSVQNTSNSSIRPSEEEAAISTTNSQVLENDFRQNSKHGAGNITILGKSFTTDEEDDEMTSSSEERVEEEKKQNLNLTITSTPDCLPVTTLAVPVGSGSAITTTPIDFISITTTPRPQLTMAKAIPRHT